MVGCYFRGRLRPPKTHFKRLTRTAEKSPPTAVSVYCRYDGGTHTTYKRMRCIRTSSPLVFFYCLSLRHATRATSLVRWRQLRPYRLVKWVGVGLPSVHLISSLLNRLCLLLNRLCLQSLRRYAPPPFTQGRLLKL